MESLTIRLLGNPEITVREEPLSFPTRKVLALLLYLVVEGGRPSRETLMTLQNLCRLRPRPRSGGDGAGRRGKAG